MYDKIFDDLLEVEGNLRQAGLSYFDETKIFNLLENLKSPKVVTQVLIESKELNESESRSHLAGTSAFSAISDFIDDQHESDVEVIKEVRKEDIVRETVDLTDTPDDICIPSNVIIEKEEPHDSLDTWNRIEEQSDSNTDSNNSMEDNYLDGYTNQNDCSNDSDVDNYYTTSDYEETDSDKREKYKTKAESPPLILSILKDLCENPKMTAEPPRDPPFEENREMDNTEILEENNNDPNNNHDLDENQFVEQPLAPPRSPVPGCSKDFVEREFRRPPSPMILSVDRNDSDTHPELENHPDMSNHTQEDGDCYEPIASCSKEFDEVEQCPLVENSNDIEEIDSEKISQTNYEKLLEETEAINKLFPDVSGDMIFSLLDKYKKATNRVTIVLFDLLPKERPEPNYIKKRKKKIDSCPTVRKKSSPLSPSSKIDDNTIKNIQRVVRDVGNAEEVSVVKEVDKRISPEIDTIYPSADAFEFNQTYTVVNNPGTKTHQLRESSRGKGKTLTRSCVIKPPTFNFQSTSLPGKKLKPVPKNSILAAPKFVPEKPKCQFTSSTPENRRSTSPTKEVTEEGFLTEETESVNTASNIPSQPVNLTSNNTNHVSRAQVVLQKPPPAKVQRLENISLPEVQHRVKKTQWNSIRTKSKKSRNAGNVNDQPSVIKARSDGLIQAMHPEVLNNPLSLPSSRMAAPVPAAPTPAAPSQNSRFQQYSANIAPHYSNAMDQNNRELENFLNCYLPNDELEPTQELDFMNPHRVNQFYQMPRMNLVPPPVYHNPLKSILHNSLQAAGLLTPSWIKTEPLSLVLPGPSSSNPATVKNEENSKNPSEYTYYKLRSIFPDVDPEFIKEKCTNLPFNANGLNAEHQLNMLVEFLLSEGSNHHQVKASVEEPADMGNKDEQYENLLGIFPEADPTYLRDFVDKNYNNPDNVKDFVQKNLENPNYPTREQYLKKVKVTEQIKQYTTHFDIKKFLQIFPDPVAHFENPDRANEYSPVVYEFLKDVFCRHKVATISLSYRRRSHHLSLTASDLRNLGPDMKSKRNCYLIPTENIPLLQEMAYVRHKQEIVDYLKQIKMNEEEEFNDLKSKSMLLECQCCFNEECMPSKCASCESGHIFCHACILRGTESKMGDGENHIKCFTTCDSEFSLSVLQEVLPPTTFSILLQKRQEAEVMAAGLEGLVSCPFCHFASIPPTESKVFKCLNPECMKETCRLCKDLNHVPLKCDEVMKSDHARRLLEEKMTEALVRTCYQCQRPFFKEEGCNKMTCVCGASMCYLCSTPLKKGDYTHFNGQGATSLQLCPLWSDNRRLNAESVRKVAEVTENEIRKKNPNLKIDTKAILPVLPPKTRGPHDDIPNANQLPEYVRRVANFNP